MEERRGFRRDTLEILFYWGLVARTRSFLLGLAWTLALFAVGKAFDLPILLAVGLAMPGFYLGGYLGACAVSRRLGFVNVREGRC